MMLQSKYDISEFVYIITDCDQLKRQITGVFFRSTGVVYECYCGTQQSEHYEFELATEPDLVLKATE